MNSQRTLNDILQELKEEGGIDYLTDTEMLWDRGTPTLIGFVPFGANFSMTKKEIEDCSNSDVLKLTLKHRIVGSIQNAIRRLESDMVKLREL